MTTTRVTLVAPALGRDLREARFAGDGPLDPAARAAATAAGAELPDAPHWFCSPTGRCRDTARALRAAAGPRPVAEPPALTGLDVGRWRGRTLGEVSADDPAGLTAWLADPAATPHGGESLHALRARVGTWLDALTDEGGRVLVVAEPDVVRAALAHALDLPGPSFWRLDVAPLTSVDLSGRSGRWNVRPGRPLG
ncbi:histidine phosphatase family protein [Streptomyces sp. NPDC127068]|uniref:histidine phosphatase family protein n=1 Tax=Streptomyces sp. NPDC127068 TaxID=3347127 RepID=UPI00365BF823